MRQTVRLASASLERRAILEEMDFNVNVRPVNLDETPVRGENAPTLVSRLSLEKLKASGRGEFWTIAADTVVDISGKVMGKPRDEEEARKTLNSLRGAAICVWTATSMLSPKGEDFHDLSSARLEAKEWSQEDVESYLMSGLWKGRAGSFSIFHNPTPVVLVEGRLDVVRGLNARAVCAEVRGEQ